MCKENKGREGGWRKNAPEPRTPNPPTGGASDATCNDKVVAVRNDDLKFLKAHLPALPSPISHPLKYTHTCATRADAQVRKKRGRESRKKGKKPEVQAANTGTWRGGHGDDSYAGGQQANRWWPEKEKETERERETAG